MLKIILPVCLLFYSSAATFAQGYLHANGKFIVDANGDEVILRGIGTGNWMLQEGYMMKSASFAGTQHEYRQKLIETIGEENTNTFYQSWLDNHFTRTDVDSMKRWGFNSVRVAMHYKWFTLPIEDEPVAGQDTWLEDGFVRIDSLLDWCGDNQMYLILDLHGAPGGQGHDANISDYDPSKPSLWESAENRRKTVALWARLAQRYADKPWMGGYDLINEPNWDLPGGTLLRQLYQQITTAIRAVDAHHMIIIEGNWFANDYTGLTPPWDNNMVYSFHKYWNFNTQGSIDWMKTIRNTYNVPIWLGESGENSNTWFTEAIGLCESNKIGWSWWPVKKDGINNVLEVTAGRNYDNLISFWETGSPVMNSEQAFAAVMEFSNNHRIENCKVKYDVIDAMMRQPFTTETLPVKIYHPGEPVHAVNYDMGRSSIAYWDADSANYYLSTGGDRVNWNQGWEYRNDGVDIEKCTDVNAGNIGYNVAYTSDGEWMQYTIQADTTAAYTVTYRSASSATPSVVHLQIDGTDAGSLHTLPYTGGWQTWSSSSQNNIILPAGTHKVRLVIDRAGSNLSFFSFTNPVSVNTVPFEFVSACTSTDGNLIYLTVNKGVTELNQQPGDFQVTANAISLGVSSVTIDPENNRKLILALNVPVRFQQVVKLSYSGTSVVSDGDFLTPFSEKDVKNNLLPRFTIPCLIQAEEFYVNNGFQLENCSDTGGGQNIGFANPGDYLDYLIYVPEAGEYKLDFRYATQSTTGRIEVRIGDGSEFVNHGSVYFPSTGGWQVWKNLSVNVNLPQGNQTLRIYTVSGEFNINWFSLATPNSVENSRLKGSLQVYPNPGNGLFRVNAKLDKFAPATIEILDVSGRELMVFNCKNADFVDETLNIQHFLPGIYMVKIKAGFESAQTRIVKY